MSDNLGPNQTRVLDPTDRSFESVTYQKRKPPLSCEVNLGGALAFGHARDVSKAIFPSGWEIGGGLHDGQSESTLMAGDVVCSSSYIANTFKLIALDKGVESGRLAAWVDGHRLVIQGTNNTSDENNIIVLDPPPSITHRIDFVFLEVWRKLLSTTDPVYKYGNAQYGGTNPTNDLVDPYIGIETSRRIQVQYRIRAVNSDMDSYPSGFDPGRVYAQGAASTPQTCTAANFLPVDGDSGLWRAGLGDEASQTMFGTVDGYVYAIPMFGVCRRNTHSYDVDNYSNGSRLSLSDYLNGHSSDRPDDLYNNWVVADDIFDMRHVITLDNVTEMAEKTFDKVIRGESRNKLVKVTLGEDHYSKIVTQADSVSMIDHVGSNTINSNPNGIRRAYANASCTQSATLETRNVNQKTFGTTGLPWASGDRVTIWNPMPTGYPAGSTVYINGAYYSAGQLTIGATGVTLQQYGYYANVVIGSSSVLIGTTNTITVDYTITFASNKAGFSMVPDTWLEAREEGTTASIALTIDPILVKDSSAVSTLSGLKQNSLVNLGAIAREDYAFGHQMTYHALGNGTQIITVPRTLYGHPIMGIVQVKVGGTIRTSVSVTRDASQYTVDVGAPLTTTNEDVEITLYVGGKFFEVNKQGRGVVDTFEMRDLSPIETVDGIATTFHVDSTNKALLAFASSYIADGYGVAFVNGTQKTLATTNDTLPTDTTKSRATLTFSSVLDCPAGAQIEVPMMMKSAIDTTEGYTFFYKAVPYQGMLDSTSYGTVLGRGPATITSLGSGAISNYQYSIGTVLFTLDSTVVNGLNTNWVGNVFVGGLITPSSHPTQQYRIVEVVDSDTLKISKGALFNGSYEAYTIDHRDVPKCEYVNVIDRLPTTDSTSDARGLSDNLSTAVTDDAPMINTRVITPVVDVIGEDHVLVGTSTAARGRTGTTVNGKNIGMKFEKLDSTASYQKTYQSYIFKEEGSDELRLMVVSSESDGTSFSRYIDESTGSDTVDVFVIDGKPLTVRR